MAKHQQVLIVVDLDADVVGDELTAFMPHERERRDVIRLTDLGAPRLERHGAAPQPVDWRRIGAAVEEAAAKVLQLGDGLSLDLYVGGFAPLPVFAHLGFALSKFAGNQTLLHRPFGGGDWQAYAISDVAGPDTPRILDAASGMPDSPSITTAHVAVYIDLNGRAAPGDAIQRLHELHGAALGTVIELRSKTAVVLTPQNAPIVARELIQELGRVPSLFPHGAGITLHLAAPAPVAFMAGRALNPTIVRNVLLTNFFAGVYEVTTTLPFEGVGLPEISSGAADVEERAKIQATLKDALEDLQSGVHPEDMPPDMDSALQARILDRLAKLTVADATTNEFGLSIAQGTVAFGAGLLEALRETEDVRARRFAQLLVLHELLHTDQGLRSTNFRDVGRAGVVLEQVDFAADVFALRVTTARALRESPSLRARDVVVPWFEVAVHGISLFDRLLDPVRIRELAERRLRRYLTWHLQLQRARTVDDESNVAALLKASITAELAPLAGKLSVRHDKIVLETLPETEFFCAVDGHLIRRGAQGTFDPRQLVEAVRTYNHELLQNAMHAIVEENTSLLAAWLP